MTNKFLGFWLVLACLAACTDHSKTEKHQNKRNNIIDVHEQVKPIEISEVLMGNTIRPHLVDQYLIFLDHDTMGKQVHVFNKHTFDYVTSAVNKGRGPGEIVNIGQLASMRPTAKSTLPTTANRAYSAIRSTASCKTRSTCPK